MDFSLGVKGCVYSHPSVVFRALETKENDSFWEDPMSQIHLKKDLRTLLFLTTSYWAPFSSSGEGKSVEEPWDLQSPTRTNISNYLKDGFGCFSSEFQLLKQLKEWCIWMGRCDMCMCFLPIFEILTVGYIGRWFQWIVNIAQPLEMVFQNKATGKVKTGFWGLSSGLAAGKHLKMKLQLFVWKC